MTESMTDKQMTYADRIAKLLRKAESTDNAHEAEAFTSKAMQLMVTYAVTEQMLDLSRGKDKTDEVVEEAIFYSGIFSAALFNIGAAVARNNHCKVLISANITGYVGDKRVKGTKLYMIGFKSDVDRARMLDASVQLQATMALNAWVKDGGISSWMSGMDKFKARREFLFGFADGLSAKLSTARREGMREAAKSEAERTHTTEAEATVSTELVIRTREEQVKDWYDDRYGSSTRTVRRNYSHGGGNARGAGSAAGRNANTGTTGIGGTKAVGR